MTKNIVSTTFSLLILLFSLSGASMAQNMKEGLWEITMTMDIPNMPVKMPARTWTQCMTKNNCVPSEENKECKIIKNEHKDDTFKWAVECKTPEGTSTGEGRIVYKGDTFEGTFKVRVSDSRESKEVVQHLKGKWIGPCKGNK